MFDELSITKLKAEERFETLLAFFGDQLEKEDIADSWDKFNNFEVMSIKKLMSISNEYKKNYSSTFHQKYKKIAQLNVTSALTNFCF